MHTVYGIWEQFSNHRKDILVLPKNNLWRLPWSTVTKTVPVIFSWWTKLLQSSTITIEHHATNTGSLYVVLQYSMYSTLYCTYKKLKMNWQNPTTGTHSIIQTIITNQQTRQPIQHNCNIFFLLIQRIVLQVLHGLPGFHFAWNTLLTWRNKLPFDYKKGNNQLLRINLAHNIANWSRQRHVGTVSAYNI